MTLTTDGYNYLVIGDDVYMYTGITSITSDESNIGFILNNQRTKETKFYAIAGAEEYSAMDSAEGQVQQMSYQATFPLLLNIADQPTYFMALKDAAGLVKMYAMVNVSQYQIVSTGSTVAACESSYRQALAENGLIDQTAAQPAVPATGSVDGVVTDIRSAVMGGNSRYFIQVAGSDRYYSISASDDQDVVILNVGDDVEIVYDTEASGTIVDAYSLTINGLPAAESGDAGTAQASGQSAGTAAAPESIAPAA